MEWKIAEAKNKFCEIVNKALLEGPQKITRRRDSVILLNEEDYKKLVGQKKTFKQHLLEGPNLEGLDLTRDQSPMRKIDL